MTFTTYKVTFEVTLKDGSHPRHWIPDTVDQGLEAGESAGNWEVEELPDNVEKVVDTATN